MAVLLLWLLAGPVTAGRMAALGAALGVAVQLHLAMVAGALAAVASCPAAPRSAGARGRDSRCARHRFARALRRLANAGARRRHCDAAESWAAPEPAHTRLRRSRVLEWHVPSAFWQWPDASGARGARESRRGGADRDRRRARDRAARRRDPPRRAAGDRRVDDPRLSARDGGALAGRDLVLLPRSDAAARGTRGWSAWSARRQPPVRARSSPCSRRA